MAAIKEHFGLSEVLASRKAKSRPQVLRRPASDVRATTLGLVVSGASVAFTHRGKDGEAFKARASLAGPCERPVYVVHDGRPHGRMGPGAERREVTAMTLETEVPCRQCPACLRFRARKWGNAAVREWLRSERTWFVTLTFEPQARYVIEATTRQRLGDGELERLDRFARFAELERATGKLVTDYLKALRDGRKAGRRRRREKGRAAVFVVEPVRFRYLLTVEPHADGFPHYHLLLHEQQDGGRFHGRGIEALWKHGFTSSQLVKSERQSFYAAKYLGKWSVARVRASGQYGETGESASQSAPAAKQEAPAPPHGAAGPGRIDPPNGAGPAAAPSPDVPEAKPRSDGD